MILARAALGHDVDERAGAAAELGAVARGQDLDLGDRVEARVRDGVAVRAVVHVVGAVHHEVRRRRPHAVDRLTGRAQADRERIGRRDHGPGQQLHQLRVVAAVQRNVVHLLAGDDAAHVSRLRLDLARRRRHGDGLGEAADLELEVGRAPGRRVEREMHALDRLETRQLDPDLVDTGRKAREHVAARGLGGDGLHEAGLLVRARDHRAGQRAARLVGHAAGDLPDVGLGTGQRRDEDQPQRQYDGSNGSKRVTHGVPFGAATRQTRRRGEPYRRRAGRVNARMGDCRMGDWRGGACDGARYRSVTTRRSTTRSSRSSSVSRSASVASRARRARWPESTSGAEAGRATIR